jgi:hypothetical protein
LFSVNKAESRIWFRGLRIDVAEKQKHFRSKTGCAKSKKCGNEMVAKAALHIHSPELYGIVGTPEDEPRDLIRPNHLIIQSLALPRRLLPRTAMG